MAATNLQATSTPGGPTTLQWIASAGFTAVGGDTSERKAAATLRRLSVRPFALRMTRFSPVGLRLCLRGVTA